LEVACKVILVEVEAAKKFANFTKVHRAAKRVMHAHMHTQMSMLREVKGNLNSPASFSKVPKAARMAMHALGIMQKTWLEEHK
jgi:hypothetical protein